MTPLAITDYDSLIATLRSRAEDLEVSRETIDSISGLAPGLSGKILGLGKIRRLGLETLGPMLGALGLKLIAVEDRVALEQNRSRMVRRDTAQARPNNDSRCSKGRRTPRKPRRTAEATTSPN